MINRRNKELSDENIALISLTSHAWRNENGAYEDKAGFCKSATLEEVRNSSYVLMPGRYAGTEEEVDDGIAFDEKMKALDLEACRTVCQGQRTGENHLRKPEGDRV